MRTTVIAEFGSTAEGRLGVMLDQIAFTARSGADVYKAQWTSDPAAMVERRHAPAYRHIYQWLAWPVEWHQDLADACQGAGIRYACSVYLPDDAQVVAPYVSAIKISSFEAQIGEMLDVATASDREVWVSTGMMSDADVNAMGWRPVTLFHCVSAYPAPIAELHLRLIRDGDYDGWSDHSSPGDVWTGALAVAAGASYVEAHVRLNGANPSHPDVYNIDLGEPMAMDPEQWWRYVANIRYAETCLGAASKGVQPCEADMVSYRAR